jgi:Helix-turn-helix domain
VAQVSETLLGLRGAADILGLSTVRVRQFISGGRLPATKVSSTWIIKESDLLAFAEHERGPGRPRLYELIVDQTEAHISVRGGRSTGICGSERGAVRRVFDRHADATRFRLCAKCRAQAPRYVVRYWLGRGAH